jgi:hypothetical protein
MAGERYRCEMENKPTARTSLRPRRLVWMFLRSGVLILLALAYAHFFLYLPPGTGPAGPTVSPEPFSQDWTQREVLLVGIGDSVTAGFGASKGHSYFDRLAANPPDEFAEMKGLSLASVIPNLRTLNISVSGSNSLQHVKHIEQKLPVQDDAVFGLVTMTTT